MGKRLTRIYTKTGDRGQTRLGDGSKVRKDHPRVEAYGTVDELNSVLGCLLSEELPETVRSVLQNVQHVLFDVGGQLCIPGYSLVEAEQVEALEQILDRLNGELESLDEFILPGGSRSASLCHLARTVCRRAERRVVPLMGSDQDEEALLLAIRYLNRLSDLLFVMARWLNHSAGGRDVIWERTRPSRRSD